MLLHIHFKIFNSFYRDVVPLFSDYNFFLEIVRDGLTYSLLTLKKFLRILIVNNENKHILRTILLSYR